MCMKKGYKPDNLHREDLAECSSPLRSPVFAFQHPISVAVVSAQAAVVRPVTTRHCYPAHVPHAQAVSPHHEACLGCLETQCVQCQHSQLFMMAAARTRSGPVKAAALKQPEV